MPPIDPATRERALVLAYLRDMAAEAAGHGLRVIAETLRVAATRIEAGDHLDDEGPVRVSQAGPSRSN